MADRKIGPLQLLAFGFDKPKFEGKIAQEISRLNDKKMLRLVDGLAIYKDQDGDIAAMETSQLSLKQATAYGAIIGGLIGIGTGDEKVAKTMASDMGARFHDRYEYGLDNEDIKDIAAELPNDSAAILLLVEHVWAIPLRDAVSSAGGMLIAQDFLSPESLIALGKEISSKAT